MKLSMKILIKIHAVIRKKGLFGLFKILNNKFWLLIKSFNLIFGLSKNNFLLIFPFDGNKSIYIPRLNYISSITNFNLFSNCISFSKRIKSEPLLRQIVYNLYNLNYIDANKSIIDIGAWIGDNAILWSKIIEDENGKGIIYAIDPSISNLEFINKVARRNSLMNLKTIHSVCSDIDGINMSFSGSIDHASFSKNSHKYNSGMKSKTLDNNGTHFDAFLSVESK